MSAPWRRGGSDFGQSDFAPGRAVVDRVSREPCDHAGIGSKAMVIADWLAEAAEALRVGVWLLLRALFASECPGAHAHHLPKLAAEQTRVGVTETGRDLLCGPVAFAQ